MADRFDNLSSSDQDLLFQTTINVAGRTGAKPYADASAWRANVDAQAKVVGFMKDAGVVGALDQKAAQAKAASDPKFAAALRLSLRSDNNSPEWTGAVTQLFGRESPQDRVQLSDAWASARPRSSRMSASTTLAPSATNPRACEEPWPRAAPVISTVYLRSVSSSDPRSGK